MSEAKSGLTASYNVKMIDDGKQHFYQIENDDRWLPGVTTILSAAIPKPALLPWALNMMGENIREYLMGRSPGQPFKPDEIEILIKEGKNIYKKKASDAAGIGTRAHKAIDDLIHGLDPQITPDIKFAVDGFLAWKSSNSLAIEMGDTKLASKLFGYGGSLDFVAFDKNEAIVFDLKTTKKRKNMPHGAYDEMGLQLAAYSQAFHETYGLKVKAAYVLWVDKERPDFKAVKVSNIPVCLEGFLAALKLYQNQKFEKFERDGMLFQMEENGK